MSIINNLHTQFDKAHEEFRDNQNSYRGNSITRMESLCAFFSGIALGLQMSRLITKEDYNSFDNMMWRISGE